jgi:hypothetical protein
MPDYQVNIINTGSVFDLKADLGLKLAAPGMIGDGYIFFKNVYRRAGCDSEETGNKEPEGQICKRERPFQWEIFLQI